MNAVSYLQNQRVDVNGHFIDLRQCNTNSLNAKALQKHCTYVSHVVSCGVWNVVSKQIEKQAGRARDRDRTKKRERQRRKQNKINEETGKETKRKKEKQTETIKRRDKESVRVYYREEMTNEILVFIFTNSDQSETEGDTDGV